MNRVLVSSNVFFHPQVWSAEL